MADTHLILRGACSGSSMPAGQHAALEPDWLLTKAPINRVTCQTVQGQLIFVANETGLGIIPQGASARRFIDEAGRLNQQLAQTAQQVTFIAAGLPLVLKGHQ